MKTRLGLFAGLPIVAIACVGRVSEENHPCPCASGWTCCAGTQVCVAPGNTCPTEDGGTAVAVTHGGAAATTMPVGDAGGNGATNSGAGATVGSAGSTCGSGGCAPVLIGAGGAPMWIAIDAKNVYWTTKATVTMAPIEGGVDTILASNLDSAWGIAVSEGVVFWTEARSPNGAIAMCSVDTDATATFESNEDNPIGIAVDQTNVYWTDSVGGTVNAAPRSGGATRVLAQGRDHPTAIAVDATHVYWADANQIESAPIAGGTPTVLAAANTPFSMAVDAANVYWTDGGSVWQLPVGGGTPKAIGHGNAFGVAIDATTVYWTDGDSVKKVPIGGGGVTTVASGLNGPWGIAVDAKNVYWSNNGDGTVMRVAK